MFAKRSSYKFQGHHDHHAGDALRNLSAIKVEENLHIEVLPGTEILDFNDSVDIVKSGKGGNSGMALVPQPSRDPHDPLVSPKNGRTAGPYSLIRPLELDLELEVSRDSEPSLLRLHQRPNSTVYRTFDSDLR